MKDWDHSKSSYKSPIVCNVVREIMGTWVLRSYTSSNEASTTCTVFLQL